MFKNLKILDRYILTQFVETFLIGIVVFTSIIFATDAFLTIVKQVTDYGIPLHVAAMLVILKMPSMVVLAVPMGVLLSTLLTVNRMNNAHEIVILRSCGVSIKRIAKPIFVCALLAAVLGFFVNEIVAPYASEKAKMLTVLAIVQKNVPDGKKNFTYKEVKNGMLKKIFHIASVEDKKLHDIMILNLAEKNTIQVTYAKQGSTTPEGWILENGAVYTINKNDKFLNTATFKQLNFDNTSEAIERIANVSENDFNFFNLGRYITQKSKELKEQEKLQSNLTEEQKMMRKAFIQQQLAHVQTQEESYDNVMKLANEEYQEQQLDELKKKLLEFKILRHEKIALPLTSIVFALIAIPLAITGPRARFNRGLMFSILILFIFYILRAVAIATGKAEILPPIIAAWLPNIVLGTWGYFMYNKKATGI